MRYTPIPFTSKSQARACFAKKHDRTNGSWNCDEFARATKSIKSLPEHKKKAETLDKAAAFKAGFLLRAIEDGLTPDEIVKRAEDLVALLNKSAFEDPTGLASWVPWAAGKSFGTLADLGIAATVGLPPLVGGAIGYGAGKLHNATQAGDIDTIKSQNRLAQYQQMAEEARRKAKLRELQDKHPGELVELG